MTVISLIAYEPEKYDLTYMWNLDSSNSQKQRAEWWLPGAGVWGLGCRWEGRGSPHARCVCSRDLTHGNATVGSQSAGRVTDLKRSHHTHTHANGNW